MRFWHFLTSIFGHLTSLMKLHKRKIVNAQRWCCLVSIQCQIREEISHANDFFFQPLFFLKLLSSFFSCCCFTWASKVVWEIFQAKRIKHCKKIDKFPLPNVFPLKKIVSCIFIDSLCLYHEFYGKFLLHIANSSYQKL